MQIKNLIRKLQFFEKMCSNFLFSTLFEINYIDFVFEAVNNGFVLISRKFAAVLLKIQFLKYARWWPRWWTCCEKTVAIATVLNLNLIVVMKSN